MINLFREIRQQLLTANKIGRYFKYAVGEIVLVVIGILIALQINTWNEQKKERNLEHDYLQLISADIQMDKEHLNGSISFVKLKMKGLKIIHDVSNGNMERTDSITWAIIESPSLGWTLSFEKPSKTTYDEMISSGNLKLINDAQMRKSIIEYYSFWSHQVERTHQRRSNYPNLTYKLFDPSNLPKSASEIRKKLKTKNMEIEFKNEIDHEINYGVFIQDSVLPRLIQKNKSMELLIKNSFTIK